MNFARRTLMITALTLVAMTGIAQSAQATLNATHKPKKTHYLERVVETPVRSKGKKKQVNVKQTKKQLSRDVVFDGSYINGRYQSAGEIVAVVEADKKMNDLVGSRKDFKDRLAIERARLKQTVAAGQ